MQHHGADPSRRKARRRFVSEVHGPTWATISLFCALVLGLGLKVAREQFFDNDWIRSQLLQVEATSHFLQLRHLDGARLVLHRGHWPSIGIEVDRWVLEAGFPNGTLIQVDNSYFPLKPFSLISGRVEFGWVQAEKLRIDQQFKAPPQPALPDSLAEPSALEAPPVGADSLQLLSWDNLRSQADAACARLTKWAAGFRIREIEKTGQNGTPFHFHDTQFFCRGPSFRLRTWMDLVFIGSRDRSPLAYVELTGSTTEFKSSFQIQKGEGRLAATAVWPKEAAAPRGQLSFKHFPFSWLLSLVEKKHLYIPFWLSCEMPVEFNPIHSGSINAKLGAWIKKASVGECALNGEPGRIVISNQPESNTFHLAAKRLKLTKLARDFEIKNMFGLFSDLGELSFEADLDQLKPLRFHAKGQIDHAKISFSRRGERGFQGLTQFPFQLDYSDFQLKLDAADGEFEQGQFQGDMHLKLQTRSGDGEFSYQVKKLLFKPLVEALMFEGVSNGFYGKGRGVLKEFAVEQFQGQMGVGEISGPHYNLKQMTANLHYQNKKFSAETRIDRLRADIKAPYFRLLSETRSPSSRGRNSGSAGDDTAGASTPSVSGIGSSNAGSSNAGSSAWQAGAWVFDQVRGEIHFTPAGLEWNKWTGIQLTPRAEFETRGRWGRQADDLQGELRLREGRRWQRWQILGQRAQPKLVLIL